MAKHDLESRFSSFDFSSELYPSFTKEAVLYALRIQALFDKIGSVKICQEMLPFVVEPNIRKALAGLGVKKLSQKSNRSASSEAGRAFRHWMNGATFFYTL